MKALQAEARAPFPFRRGPALQRLNFLALGFLLCSLNAHAWNTSTGLVDPGTAQRVRTNPAARGLGAPSITPNGLKAFQSSARYSTVTGGPILGFDIADLYTPTPTFGISAGAEYSLATSNPELHLAGSFLLSPHFSVGSTSAVRRTPSEWQVAAGAFIHYASPGEWAMAASVQRMGRGTKAMEFSTGVAQRQLFSSALDGELDLIYRTSSQALALKPAFRVRILSPWVLVLGSEVPLQAPASFWTETRIAYERPSLSVQLGASTNLDFAAQVAFPL